MMTWYQILSLFFTNGLRIFLGLYLVTTLLKLSGNMMKATALSVCASACITALSCFPIQQFFPLGAEVFIIASIAYYVFTANLRICLFLSFFYEITVALWEFIISASLGVVFRSESFLDAKSPEYAAAVWIVRLFMSGIALIAVKKREKQSVRPSRTVSVVATAGLLGVVVLSEQDIIAISDDQLTPWLFYSVLIPLAILFYELNRQNKMAKTIAQLEKEKNALLERDYQTLSDTYAANAKLFHDLHNHIDALHRYLSKGSTAEAIVYLENLRSPMQSIRQTAWTGDEAVDYLLNSKIALAVSQNIRVNTDIEFPRHTNILSVDLVTILGNLLDNSLEATEGAEDSLRFIELKIRRINDMLVIKAENGCSTAPAAADGNFQTPKTDKALHGWGLRSVRTVAERYDGTLETAYGDHTFHAVVTLSFEAIRVQ